MNNLVNRIKNSYPIIIIIFLTFIFFYPFFIYGDLYIPGDILQKFYPWRYELQKESIKPLSKTHDIQKSPASDITKINYPHDDLYNKMLKNGKLALWNPYNFCGHPLMAEGRTAMLYPLKLILSYLFDTGKSYTLIIIINHILLGLGMFYFLRHLKLSKISSLFGALVWMYNGYVTDNLEYSTHIQAGVFFAFNCLLIDSFLENPQKKQNYFLLILSMGLGHLSGHLQYVFYAFTLSILYFIFRIISKLMQKNRKGTIKIIILFSLAVFISLMIGAGQLIPSFELMTSSCRPKVEFNNHDHLTLLNMANLIYPCAVGDNEGNFYFSPEGSGIHNHMEINIFIGIGALHLLILAFLYGGWKKEKIFFSTFILLPFLILYKIPPFNFIFYLPVFGEMNPLRLLLFYQFAVSIICAIGLENLLTKISDKKIIIFTLIMLVLFLVNITSLLYCFSYVSNNIGDIMESYMKTRLVYKGNTQLIMRKILKNYSIENPFFVLPVMLWAIVLFLFYSMTRFNRKNLIVYFLIIVTVGELFFYGFKNQPRVKKEDLYFKTNFTEFIMKNNRYGRVSSYDNPISSLPPANTLLPYSIMDVSGYASFYPGRYYKFIKAIENRYLSYLVPVIEKPKNFSPSLEKILGIKYYFNMEGHDFPLKSKFPNNYRTVYSGEKLELIENLNSSPLFFSVGSYRVIKDEENIIDFMFHSEFNPEEEIILEEQIKEVRTDQNKGKRNDTIEIQKLEPGEIELKIIPQDKEPFLLFISDNYYPGWEARVNGKQVPIYCANYLFKAIPVVSDQETIHIKLFFFPLLYKISFLITVITSIIIITALILSKKYNL